MRMRLSQLKENIANEFLLYEGLLDKRVKEFAKINALIGLWDLFHENEDTQKFLTSATKILKPGSNRKIGATVIHDVLKTANEEQRDAFNELVASYLSFHTDVKLSDGTTIDTSDAYKLAFDSEYETTQDSVGRNIAALLKKRPSIPVVLQRRISMMFPEMSDYAIVSAVEKEQKFDKSATRSYGSPVTYESFITLHNDNELVPWNRVPYVDADGNEKYYDARSLRISKDDADGEMLVAALFNGQRSSSDTFTYDVLLPGGQKLEVKSITRSSGPVIRAGVHGSSEFTSTVYVEYSKIFNTIKRYVSVYSSIPRSAIAKLPNIEKIIKISEYAKNFISHYEKTFSSGTLTEPFISNIHGIMRAMWELTKLFPYKMFDARTTAIETLLNIDPDIAYELRELETAKLVKLAKLLGSKSEYTYEDGIVSLADAVAAVGTEYADPTSYITEINDRLNVGNAFVGSTALVVITEEGFYLFTHNAIQTYLKFYGVSMNFRPKFYLEVL